MREFIFTLSNPAWWLSVVFAGIAINLASSYLKNILDRYASTTAGRWRKLSKRKQEKWEAYVSSLSTNPEAFEASRHREMRALLKANFFLIFAVFFSLVVILTPANKSIAALAIISTAFLCGSIELLIAFLYLKDARREQNAQRDSKSES